jgi:predicted TIM-barrel fold metal-dependent hydrolase
MPSVIDADTHVDESEATWKSLEGPYAKYIPLTVNPSTEGVPPGVLNTPFSRWWLVDGKLQSRIVRDDAHHPPIAARELHDPQIRLQDMDRLGVDMQVIFPTFFIRYIQSNGEADAALTKTYNRWIAERCASSNGRLQWIAVLPMLNTDNAVEELRWAKSHGACGFFKRGYDLEKKVSDPHFFPIYEEAGALGMPVCIHSGHPGFPAREWDRGFPIMGAFIALLTSRLPDKFPKLRFGFIEAGASWIPYALSQLATQQRQLLLHDRAATFDLKKDLFRANRLFVAIDPVDDIEYVLTFGTEDNLIIGTDYCHSDMSANLNALEEVQGWADQGRISEKVARKILDTNPRALYGLQST